jgi:long-subunit fatty acid transport protein
MKNLLLALLIVSKFTYGQFIDSSKFGINSEIGFSVAELEHSVYGKVAGNTFQLGILASYRLNERMSISSGLILQNFSGNIFVNNLNSNLTNQYFQFPLKFNVKSPIFKELNENIRFIAGLGAYANFMTLSSVSNSASEIKSENVGWNMVLNVNVGMNFRVNKKSYVSLLYDLNTEFGKISKNNISQRMNYSNGFKIGVNHNF